MTSETYGRTYRASIVRLPTLSPSRRQLPEAILHPRESGYWPALLGVAPSYGPDLAIAGDA